MSILDDAAKQFETLVCAEMNKGNHDDKCFEAMSEIIAKAEQAQAIDEKYVTAMNATDGPRSGLFVQWLQERDALDAMTEEVKRDVMIIVRQISSPEKKLAQLNALIEQAYKKDKP